MMLKMPLNPSETKAVTAYLCSG